ncbi:hypothetical protein RvY_15635 [Ramazzottius varieornatus]|uniref:CKK domain-containing protein n=1 Tax=Ramazzottius varieornatus TaxID=947166 RepID=A0A1D1W2D4_RAMVA|nr:hypothetical protein RvY_15635 [Ramazzottius varieornatus]
MAGTTDRDFRQHSHHNGFASASPSMSEEEGSAKTKERDALLWLMSIAHEGNIREDLKEPYYSDGQGNKLLKPDYVLGLTSGELYASALGNIFKNPALCNFTHDQVLQLLHKRSLRPVYADDSDITETDLGFNRPIRLRAHLILIETIMLLAQKEFHVSSLSGLLKESARLAERTAGKKTAFAPLPNTNTWTNYSGEDSFTQRHHAEDLPENNIQPGHPQVTNIKLALEEKRRKKQDDRSKKGFDWMRQTAKLGETAFMQSSHVPAGHHRGASEEEEEHVYEEISENKTEKETVISAQAKASESCSPGQPTNRRAKWNEQEEYGGGHAPSPSVAPLNNLYSTRQPPRPLPRRRINSVDRDASLNGESSSESSIMNGRLRAQPSADQPDDSLAESSSQKNLPQARTKPKVIRIPPATSAQNGSVMSNVNPFNSITNRLRSPVVQREFVNSVDVLNPTHDHSPLSNSTSPPGSTNSNVENIHDGDANTSFDIIEQNKAEMDMERKRQKLMQLQLKRQSELEAARMSKEQENAEKNELTRQRLEEANRKKEEQRLRQQAVFEQYQKRKLEAEKEDNPAARQGTVLREPKARRARPLSVHANTIHQVSVPTSHEPTAMKRVSSQGDILKLGQELSILSLHNPRLAAASARQVNGSSGRRALSPPGRMPMQDSTSDAGSSNSGQEVYTGPKLFKKPSAKSNRLIIHNAIRDCCLPGIVNEDVQRKVLDTLARCEEGSHFFVLFRDANCQFRGVYVYDPDINEATKIFGTGPTRIDDSMTEKLYKYNSGSKKFSVIPTTHHMSVQIDGVTIQQALWLGKKTTGLKPPLDIF